jgi:hypothetical protein
MMSDVAKGLKSFKHGLAEDDQQERRPPEQQPQQQRSLPQERPIDITPINTEPATPPPPPPSDEQRR